MISDIGPLSGVLVHSDWVASRPVRHSDLHSRHRKFNRRLTMAASSLTMPPLSHSYRNGGTTLNFLSFSSTHVQVRLLTTRQYYDRFFSSSLESSAFLFPLIFFLRLLNPFLRAMSTTALPFL